VLPSGHVWTGPAVNRLAVGGPHRAASVRAGLAVVPEDAEIAVVADAAHPLASPSLYRALVDAVRRGADGAVPGMPLLEVVQRVRNAQLTETLPKGDLVMTQTPQAFRLDLLRAAHRDLPETVDDSSLLVELGHEIRVIPGEPWNLHVSTSAELAVLERLADPPWTSPTHFRAKSHDRDRGSPYRFPGSLLETGRPSARIPSEV